MKIYENFMFLECSDCKNKIMMVKDNSLIDNIHCPHCGMVGYLEQEHDSIRIEKAKYVIKRK